MSNEYDIVTDFNEDELHDLNMIISHSLIPKLIKYADDYNFERDSIIKFTADLLTAMSETATFENFKDDEIEQRWIPVTERVPEYGEGVLTVSSDGDYEINHIMDDDLNEWFYDGVVAWMPLPKPYKAESEEKDDSENL